MLDFWRAKIIKNIDNADLCVRNDIDAHKAWPQVINILLKTLFLPWSEEEDL